MLDNNAVDIESVCIVASGRLPGAGVALEGGGGVGLCSWLVFDRLWDSAEKCDLRGLV